MPYKHGQSKTVHFGFMDINLGSAIEFSIQYEVKGVIKSLHLEGNVSKSELDSLHGLCLSADSIVSESCFIISTVLESQLPPFASSIGDEYRLFQNQLGESVLEVQFFAFDPDDAIHLAASKIQQVCDLLSVFTNSYVKMTKLICSNSFTDINQSSDFSGDLDWIDDHPIENGLITLANYQKLIINQMLQGNIKSQFVSGAAHFNNAAYLLRDYSLSKGAITDTAIVLYVSALEAFAMTKEVTKDSCSSCSSCGQVKYSIRRRVLDLVDEFLPKHLVKFIDGYYASRSKFLHEGIHSSTNNYFGKSIPQLSPNSDSGCHMPATIMQINLRDYVSYIFRGTAIKGVLKS